MRIRLGHSPDPDDAFMFWALAAGTIDTRGFDGVAADRVDDVRPVEQAGDLWRAHPVAHVRVVEDLLE